MNIPRYRHLAVRLERRLQSDPGFHLPGIEYSAHESGVSYPTMWKAYRELAAKWKIRTARVQAGRYHLFFPYTGRSIMHTGSWEQSPAARAARMAAAIIACALSSNAAVHYSGRVIACDRPVAGALVSLAGSTLWAQSDGQGAFDLAGEPNAALPVPAPACRAPAVAFRNRCIVATCEGGQAIRLLVYTMAGRTVASARGNGAVAIPVPRAASVFVVRVVAGASMLTGRMTTLGGNVASFSITRDRNRAIPPAGGPAKTLLISASSLAYLSAAKAGFFPGYATATADTGSGIVISLVDSSILAACPACSLSVKNIRYEYWEAAVDSLAAIVNLGAPTLTGTVDSFSLSMRRRDTDFALRFACTLDVAQEGAYWLGLRSDDGSRIVIDSLILDNDGIHPAASVSRIVKLSAGKHAATVLYFQRGGEMVFAVTMRALPLYLNPAASPVARARDLVSRMTAQEKAGQMVNTTSAIPRLGVPSYDYWNECLHGVARNGAATSFPQAIGMAAMWDTALMYRIGTAISDEARAKHHAAARAGNGNTGMYQGLTFWSPNINIFRDPRWGRGQETYGEDPFLTSRYVVSFVNGLQGDDPRYLKLVGTPKHFAVFSGPGNSGAGTVSERDLRQTYLPAFKAGVMEGHAASVMCSYNAPNGVQSCSNTYLLQQILRTEWGFTGYVTSDCGAMYDFAAGCDVSCGSGSAAAADVIDTALVRLFTQRMRLGMFDPPAMAPYASIPMSVVECQAHKDLALRAARESMVLLKNAANVLPLSKSAKIAVIGPHADWGQVYLGNYNGEPSHITTILEGMRTKVPAANLSYEKGCDVTATIAGGYARADSLARLADVVVATVGLRSESAGSPIECEGCDRADLNLPAVQDSLITLLAKTGKPLVLVFINGSPVSDPVANDSADAIIEAWYPGQAGDAVADALFGDYNPGGKLPVTFYASVNQCAAITDYDMTNGRTYRYLAQEPLYRFGHGLSYTTFAYSGLSVAPASPTTLDTMIISATVANTGQRDGDEVVQLYVHDDAASVTVPVRELKAFARVHLAAGETRLISFRVTPYQLSLINGSNKRVIEPGAFSLWLSGGQPNAKNPSNVLSGSFVMGGAEQEFTK